MSVAARFTSLTKDEVLLGQQSRAQLAPDDLPRSPHVGRVQHAEVGVDGHYLTIATCLFPQPKIESFHQDFLTFFI